jgi:predicted nucleotidyltransferase
MDAIATLEQHAGHGWSNLSACAEAAKAERERVSALAEKYVPADCSFVTFGSLARNEFTPGSDLDWALLIDGSANPQHLDMAKEVARLLGDKAPGPTNVFGCPIFSHDLVHLIGGQSDTNSNTTRHILLLLESRALIESASVRDRVMRHLFRRYIQEDRGYHAIHEYAVRVPRFLLNDIVRFWRIMAVDYAHKRRERDSDGWAIRNFKLRVSRKLIFVAGLAMCLSCQLRPSPALRGKFDREDDFNNALQDFLLEFCNRTPLEVLARLAVDFSALDAGVEALDAYNDFLGILSDADKRKRLKELDVEDAQSDDVFREARAVGTRFQDSLSRLFFGSNSELTMATQRYGVF